jgi:hypothetical protein
VNSKQNQDKNNEMMRLNHFEMKVADLAFASMRNNLFLIKDLRNPKVHYSMFIIGSKLDFHLTSEAGSKNKHVKLLELEIDWDYFFSGIISYMQNNIDSILFRGKIADSKCKDMNFDFLTPEMIKELFQNNFKGKRLTIDENFLSKLEKSLNNVKFSELENKGITLGWSSKGYLALCDGTDCVVFDFEKLIEIINKNFDLSIRKFYMKYYNLKLIAFWVKIKLLNLNRVTVNYLRRNTK